MTARKAPDLDGNLVAPGGLHLHIQGDVRHLAAGATAAEGAFGAAVQVDQPAGFDAVELQVVGADEAHFLRGGEDALQRRMNQVLFCQQRHHPGQGHAVVRAQGGAFGPQDIALYCQFDGVFCEIMLYAPVFFAHHVGVALEHQRRQVFAAFGAGFYNINVQRLIPVGFQAVFLGEIQQILADRPLVARAPGDLADFFKIPQSLFGLSVAQQIFHVVAPPMSNKIWNNQCCRAISATYSGVPSSKRRPPVKAKPWD